MAPERTPASPTDERKLLIDAVTLLARNQAETESALAEQAAESSRRMLALERRCLDLEQQLGSMREELRTLSGEISLAADPESQQRLIELRDQLARLSQRAEPGPAPPTQVTPQPAPDFATVRPAPADRPAAPVAPVPPHAVWRGSDVLTQDNAGLVLIGVGAVAVLFAILTQVHV